jgi:glyoxylase-like metal-dependent hydrolase (beta-lactamase superfamily II)
MYTQRIDRVAVVDYPLTTGGDMQVLPNVHQLTLRGVNVILIAEEELTLIDTGFRGSLGRITDFINRLGRSLDELGLIILTHNHLDHCGGLPELTAATSARVAAHRADLSDTEAGLPYHGFVRKMLNVPPIPLIQPLVYARHGDVGLKLDGGEVLPPLGGLQVIHTPGHTPGSISLFSAREKLLIVGDTLNNRLPRLRLPPANVSMDLSQLKGSLKQLTEFDFETLCFGHGRPIIGGAWDRLRRFLARAG